MSGIRSIQTLVRRLGLLGGRPTSRRNINPRIDSTIERVIQEHLSYLGADALHDLALVALENERMRRPGAILEAGCAAGGSAIVLASAKDQGRPMYVFDAFGMIPPPSGRDGQDVHERYRVIASGQASGPEGGRYYGYEADLHGKVVASFASFGLDVREHDVHLVKGLYQDTLAVDGPVALAHIDCDWYDSVTVCLERIVPHLVRGGTLIIDDYDAWSGCRAAVDDYFRALPSSAYRFVKKNRLHIIKL